MRVLIYKRTHTGDPNAAGQFGCYGCMGKVRDRAFDAVIGVGGIGRDAVAADIDRKITWIGIGPHHVGVADDGFPIWAFEKFYRKDANGKPFSELAPLLAQRMFKKHGARSLMVSDNPEAAAVLKLARLARPSAGLFTDYHKLKSCKPSATKKRCRPKHERSRNTRRAC